MSSPAHALPLAVKVERIEARELGHSDVFDPWRLDVATIVQGLWQAGCRVDGLSTASVITTVEVERLFPMSAPPRLDGPADPGEPLGSIDPSVIPLR